MSKKADPVFEYRDVGCVKRSGPFSCLACPFASCVLDSKQADPRIAHNAAVRVRIRALLAEGHTHPEIMAALRVARGTIYNAIREGSK